jgi:hypothetical protein
MENTLQRLKDDLAREAFGLTASEAIQKGVCIRCQEIPRYYTEAGRREYFISAVCEPCYDEMTGGTDHGEMP